MAQERMADATPSASSRSSGSPSLSVRLRRAYTDLGRWVRWAAGPKTLRPKTWFAGAVRSGEPSCPPFGLHCAAARLRWAVVDKLKTPSDVVGGFDRTRSGGSCPCTSVEDFARRIRQRGEAGRTAWRISRREGRTGGELRPLEHFKPAMRDRDASLFGAVAVAAGRTHGVVAHWQLIAFGVTSSTVQRWFEGGRLHRLYLGVYAVGHTALTVHARWLAGVLACGPHAVLGHQPAGALLDLRRSSSPIIHVTTPRRANPRGIRV